MSTTLEQVPTGTYALDTVHSSIGFGVKYNIGTFRSTFDEVDAQFVDGVLPARHRSARSTSTSPSSSRTYSPRTSSTPRATPTITFRSTEIRPAADGSVEIDGELTIRGVTRTVTATGTYSRAATPTGTTASGSTSRPPSIAESSA